MNIQLSITIPEEIEALLTELYIKRLKENKRSSRSAVISEAIEALWDKENQ